MLYESSATITGKHNTYEKYALHRKLKKVCLLFGGDTKVLMALFVYNLLQFCTLM